MFTTIWNNFGLNGTSNCFNLLNSTIQNSQSKRYYDDTMPLFYQLSFETDKSLLGLTLIHFILFKVYLNVLESRTFYKPETKYLVILSKQFYYMP